MFGDLVGAYDPLALDLADQLDLISNAEFTEDWPCGRGWAKSTADQRVGIVIYQVDDQQPTPDSSLSLPDSGWTAEVLVGKHLFADHCNDAVEEWMPSPMIASRFVLAGTVSIHDPVPANSEIPKPVTGLFGFQGWIVGSRAQSGRPA